MRALPRLLINTRDIELWPADLLRATGSHDARALARGRWVLRSKQDGRYLAVAMDDGLWVEVSWYRVPQGPTEDGALPLAQRSPGCRVHVLSDAEVAHARSTARREALREQVCFVKPY